MAMRLISLLAIFLSPFAEASPPYRSHVVIRGASRSGTAQKLTFGMTDRQQTAVYQLTRGKVDFRGLQLVTVPNYRGERSEGVLYTNVPPPVVYGAADPELNGQWWHEKHELEKAWQISTGKGVIVADCDAGFYIKEPDLFPNLLLDHRYDLSDTSNPFVVDDGGFISHGTAVTAILAGVKDGKGTNGMAFDAKIVPLQNFNYAANDKLNKEEATARCILRAITIAQVRVIVLENQTGEGSSETFVGTRNAVRLALASGVTIVSAGGNYTKELKQELADDTGSIIVGAVNSDGVKESWSNYGKRVSVAAFGSRLHTLKGPNGAMGSFGGTSGATPQVAAAVAMMLQVNPALTPITIRAILERTRLTKPENEAVGGQLQLVRALEAAKTVRDPGLARAQIIRRRLVQIFANP